MAGDDPVPTDPVAAAFARLADEAHAAQPVGTRLDQALSVLNGLIVLGILLAVAMSTCALLSLWWVSRTGDAGHASGRY
jgi:hypothetical protein